jgi:hypothetical protein
VLKFQNFIDNCDIDLITIDLKNQMEKAQGFYVRVNVIQMYLQGGNFTADHTGACVASNARRTNAVLDPETTSCIYLEHKKRLYEMNSAYA